MVSEVGRADAQTSPVSILVLSAGLVEAALAFVVKHARDRRLPVFGSREFERDPKQWRIEDLIAGAAYGGDEAILDDTARRRVTALVTTRQRIHAGRLLSERPTGPIPDLRPEEARDAKVVADLVVRAVLAWLDRHLLPERPGIRACRTLSGLHIGMYRLVNPGICRDDARPGWVSPSRTGNSSSMLEHQLLAEFSRRLRSETMDRLSEARDSSRLDRAAALAEVMIEYLEEAGAVSEHEPCPHEDTTGRNRCRVIGYALAEESTRLELFTSAYVDDELGTLPPAEIGTLTGRAARFFSYAATGEFDRFAASGEAAAAARHIADQLERIEEVRVHVLTNGVVKSRDVDQIEILGRRVEFLVVDVERLFRMTGEEVSRDRILVDFKALQGRPIPCLEMRPASAEYATFLLIVPGELLFRLYEQYGPKLLEFNVRSFLQVKVGVNKGIRETLRDEPERFLAYNNGLAATADEIEVGTLAGETVIHRIRGLQVVNGGQTLASIHRACKTDRMDISQVAVAMKLTRVDAAKLAEFVPLISKYANTQNVIQVADLSANTEFHIVMEQMSERIWCPGEETRWFYERARGGYQTALTLQGSSPARKREFESKFPKSQRFGKTELAAYLMAWWRKPHFVSRGAQKNFSFCMDEIRERRGSEWQPDDAFYRDSVALALLFTSAVAAFREARLQSYKAQVAAYMVARLSADFEEDVDLPSIWEAQEAPERIVRAWKDWAPRLHAEIVASAGSRNIGEWCKKEDCWSHVRTIPLELPKPLPTPKAPAAVVSLPGSPAVDESVTLCKSLDGPAWARVIEWSAHPGRVASFDRQVAHSIAGMALGGWQHAPSAKQAKFGARVIRAAADAGILTTG